MGAVPGAEEFKKCCDSGGVFLICFFFRKALHLIRSKEAYTKIISRRTGYPLIIFEEALFLYFLDMPYHYIVRDHFLHGVPGHDKFC